MPCKLVALTRFQQLSAPLCAKAVEDTAFYRYGRLMSRNDVGFDRGCSRARPPNSIAACKRAPRDFPHAMLATATHDHKRGEDVRARLAVLSESRTNGPGRRTMDQAGAPHCASAPDSLLPTRAISQFCFKRSSAPGRLDWSSRPHGERRRIAKRIAAWQQKALREAKLSTDWTAPNEVTSTPLAEFVALAVCRPSELLSEIADFAPAHRTGGAINSLAQLC